MRQESGGDLGKCTILNYNPVVTPCLLSFERNKENKTQSLSCRENPGRYGGGGRGVGGGGVVGGGEREGQVEGYKRASCHADQIKRVSCHADQILRSQNIELWIGEEKKVTFLS